jgi:peptidoglycan/LPS O-acetylase OafA/YrhL
MSARRVEDGRVLAIDALRGIAILWVIGYHLWTDLRFPNVYPKQSDAFRQVPRQLTDADVPGAIAAAAEALLRVGYLGVPLFMLLSGYALTRSALRRSRDTSGQWRPLPRRLRRLLVPYYAGFAITIAFASALACVQWQRHGGAPLSDFLRDGDINLHNDQLLAGALIVPRIFRDEWQFAPEGSLWFVLLLLQYYLLFPLLLALVRRVGPAPFLGAAFAVTLSSAALMIAAAGSLMEHRSWVEMGAPFRIADFAAGMALAYGVAHRDAATELLQRPAAAWGSLALGALAFVAGCLVPLDSGYASAMQWPLIVTGLAMLAAPVLSGAVQLRPERFVASLGAVGVVSYTVLIINEPLRSITHTLRAEGAATGWVALWVIVGLLPLTFVLARPLASILGLIERPTGVSPMTISDLVESTDKEQAIPVP